MPIRGGPRSPQSEEDISIEDLIADEDIVVTITHNGYIKRLPVTTYKSQRRGGKGITGINTKEEDFVEHLFITSTHDHVLFFTNQGRVYQLRGFDIPEASRQARGIAIVNLIPLNPGEKINTYIPVKEFREDLFLLMCTRNGIVKKTALSQYANNRRSGLIGINLDEGDEVIGVRLTDGNTGDYYFYAAWTIAPLFRNGNQTNGADNPWGERDSTPAG